MPDFSFRLRFQLAPNEHLFDPESPWVFVVPNSPQNVQISPCGRPADFVAVSSGWASAEEAREAGERFQAAMLVAFAQTGLGIDFGRRMQQGWVMASALEGWSKQAGCPVLNDEPRLMVYESAPAPRFIRVGSPAVTIGRGLASFEVALTAAAKAPRRFSTREQLAFELLNAASFETSNETRFLSLVMAIETLLEPQPRSAAARAHVEHLLNLTEQAEGLSNSERSSLLGSLARMENESIGQAARRLARECLGDRVYKKMTAPKFVTEVYSLRSRLVHGNLPIPSTHEVGSWIPELRRFVVDLLAGPVEETTG